MKLFQNYSIIFLTVGLMITLISCDSSTTSVNSEPPELPPVESVELNFSLFTDVDLPPESGALLNNINTPYSHFFQASARAFLLNSIVGPHLTVPVIVLSGAETVEPELNSEDDWEWNYSVSSPNQELTVRITAEGELNGQYRWNIYGSNTVLNLDNELLFSGISSPDNSFGGWTFYQFLGLNAGEPISELRWTISDISDATLQLEILTDRLNRLGDIVSLEKNESIKRTSFINANENTFTEIEWNTDTKEGYMITPDYNSGEQACWNGSFINTECE